MNKSKAFAHTLIVTCTMISSYIPIINVTYEKFPAGCMTPHFVNKVTRSILWSYLRGLRDDVQATVPEDGNGAVKVGGGEVVAEEDEVLVQVLQQVGWVAAVVTPAFDRLSEQPGNLGRHFPDYLLHEQDDLKLKAECGSVNIDLT